MRVFGVDYRFLSCGDVFTDGLSHASTYLGLHYRHAGWDTPDLDTQIAEFAPDLIFVVHGRSFAQRFYNLKGFGAPTAVWLLDEPYEVDDCASWSGRFDHVFVNDRATLDRHPGSIYLPVCYDPHVHRPGTYPRIRKVGFIGGCNGTRERYLAALAHEGLLDYVVGSEWTDPAVQAVCLGRNVRPNAVAELYGVAKIVLNVFRETHHYNREGIAATAMNPRIYEALACGANVVSEWRPEIADVFPELLTFRSEHECVDLVRRLLNEPERAAAIQAACAGRLQGHTYADRLMTVLDTVGLAVAA